MTRPLRVLHVRTDNPNFFDATVAAYDIPEYENTYLIHAAAKDHAYWKGKGPNVHAVEGADLVRAVEAIAYDILVVHYISGRSAQVIRRARPDALVVWSSWGCDYQDLIGNREAEILMPETLRIVRGCAASSWRAALARQSDHAQRLVRDRLIRQALPRIDVMTHVKPDFDKMAALYPRIHALQHRIGYYSLDTSFAFDPVEPGPMLQVGNSADPCMNHAESFAALRKVWDGEREILCPLSYGDARYADRVEALGRRHFGARFRPIREFLPIKAYNELVAPCGAFFLNSIRQKAVGNIALALYQGRTVYLHPANPLHHTFREIGAILLTTDDALRPTAPHQMLSPAQRAANRQAIAAYFSREALQNRARALTDFYRDRRTTSLRRSA